MRIIIDCEEYVLNDWFANKENITQKQATVERETEKAMLLRYNNDLLQWIPKSQLNKIEIQNTKLNNY